MLYVSLHDNDFKLNNRKNKRLLCTCRPKKGEGRKKDFLPRYKNKTEGEKKLNEVESLMVLPTSLTDHKPYHMNKI